MQLGKETASVTNWLYSRDVSPEPVVGMGATMLGWTDRYAGTVIAVDGKIITVQEDRAIRTDNNGMSESQSYLYELNPKGQIRQYRRTKYGWQACFRNPETGRWKREEGSGGLMLGERCAYRDYSF